MRKPLNARVRTWMRLPGDARPGWRAGTVRAVLASGYLVRFDHGGDLPVVRSLVAWERPVGPVRQ